MIVSYPLVKRTEPMEPGVPVIAMKVLRLSLPIPTPTSSRSWVVVSPWALPTLPVVVAWVLSSVLLPMSFSLVLLASKFPTFLAIFDQVAICYRVFFVFF